MVTTLARWTAALAVGLVVLAFAPATPALAAGDMTLGFEELPADALVGDQYQPQGVRFGTAADFGQPSPGGFDCGSPRTRAVGFAASGTHVAELGCPTPEFHNSGTFGGFSDLRRRMSVKVRATASTTVNLVGYGEGGVTVAASSGSVDFSGWTTIVASSSTSSIKYFAVYRQDAWSGTLWIDDLSYDNSASSFAASGVSFAATAGIEFDGAVAHFSDSDPTASPADYVAAIDWGDGERSAGTVSRNGALYDISARHTFTGAGTYAVTVTISKGDGRQASATSTANVAASAMPDFNLSVSPPSVAIEQGDTAVYRVTIAGANGFAGAVRLSLEGISGRARFVPGTIAASGSARLTVFTGAGPGTYRLTIIGTSGSLARSADAQLVITAPPTPPPQPPSLQPVYNMRANGIEVTQGIQPSFTAFRGGQLPSNCLADGLCQRPVWSPVHYQGVLLAAHSETVARVFADWTTAPIGGFAGPLGNVRAELHGYRNGHELPLSPLLDEEGAITLPRSESLPGLVSREERLRSEGAFTFTLPDEWARGSVSFKAVVRRLSLFGPLRRAAATQPVECGRPDCRLDNSFTLTDVPFTPTAHVIVAPLRLVVPGGRPLDPPERVFSGARTAHPGGERIDVLPYVADIPVGYIWRYTGQSPACQDKLGDDGKVSVGRCQSDAISDRVRHWAARHAGLYDLPIGVSNRGNGAAAYSIYNLPTDNPDREANPSEVGAQPYAWVMGRRPLTSVAHELGHNLGEAHAGQQCGGQVFWPPDNRGDIQGVGLDLRRPAGPPSGRPAPYRVVAPGAPGYGDEVYDVMSYCDTREDNRWISTRNWNRELAALNRFGHRVGYRPRGAPSTVISIPRQPQPFAAAPAAVRVDAVVDEAGARIVDVLRPVGPTARPNASDYRLVMRDRDGRAVAEAPMASIQLTAHFRNVVELTAQVRAPGAVTAEIWHGATLLASRNASSHAPSLSVVAPRGGSVGGGGRVTVRWRAADRDGDALTADVYSSADNGRTWRLVYSGSARSRAVLPASYFPASARARLLVTVSDGFNETTVMSRRFRSTGISPRARILAPTADQGFLSSSTVLLEGEAFDDRLRPIGGHRLRWYAGRRKLGTGRTLTVRSLPTGRVTLRLVATDARGRHGHATQHVRVRGVSPAFLQLMAPSRLSHRARRMRVAVASSLPARLIVSGRGVRTVRARAGLRLRRVQLRVRPGRRPLVLGLALVAAGRRSMVTLKIPR